MSARVVGSAGVLAVVIALSGCGGSKVGTGAVAPSPSSNPPSSTAAPVPTSTLSDKGPLTVYSGQHEQTVQALVKDFEARTGAKVALRSGGFRLPVFDRRRRC